MKPLACRSELARDAATDSTGVPSPASWLLHNIDSRDFALLNDFQRDFPLASSPFAILGDRLGMSEEGVLTSLMRLQGEGRVSRVGPVFAPNRIGASTLAALSVPEADLDAVAARVSARPEVNHNYRREHAWNLWFVAAAPDEARLAEVLDGIARDTGLPVLALPLEGEFHIDLGFDLRQSRVESRESRGGSPALSAEGAACDLPGIERQLIAALQGGLPLVPRPFAAVAAAAGLNEATALAMIEELLASGIIKRFGVVVRHHELGWHANAMCVWDVPDERADELGAELAAEPAVTLCYRRRRGTAERAVGWPYNLFCMIHGRERQEVERLHGDLSRRLGLAAFPCDVLFSTQRYKQCGARYVPTPEVCHG